MELSPPTMNAVVPPIAAAHRGDVGKKHFEAARCPYTSVVLSVNWDLQDSRHRPTANADQPGNKNISGEKERKDGGPRKARMWAVHLGAWNR